MRIIRLFRVISILFILFLILSYIDDNYNNVPDKIVDNFINLKNSDEDLSNLQNIIDNTYAEGVIVYDVKNNKILGQKNIDRVYSLASLTKIVTGYLVYEQDKTKLNDIRNMMKTSDNREAEKLADVFNMYHQDKISYINYRVSKYNLFFRNASGLDIKDVNGNRIAGGQGKPIDIIYFIKDYYNKYPEIFDQTIVESKDNTNIIVKDLKFLTGGKTGYTDLSGGNLFVSVQKGLGRDIFILVLNSTEKNRFVDVQNIADFLVKSNI